MCNRLNQPPAIKLSNNPTSPPWVVSLTKSISGPCKSELNRFGKSFEFCNLPRYLRPTFKGQKLHSGQKQLGNNADTHTALPTAPTSTQKSRWLLLFAQPSLQLGWRPLPLRPPQTPKWLLNVEYDLSRLARLIRNPVGQRKRYPPHTLHHDPSFIFLALEGVTSTHWRESNYEGTKSFMKLMD